jgi:murein DD-endopeptidase MepM/ murein hydrolase activator NlpD
MSFRSSAPSILALAALAAGCAGPRAATTGADVTNAWGPIRVTERYTGNAPRTPRQEPVVAVAAVSGPDGEAPSATDWMASDEPVNDAPVTECTEPLEETEPLYLMPYAEGDEYYVRQATCGPASHRGRFSFAYDFDMPRGTPVLAARNGVVSAVVTGHPEGTNRSGDANYVVIRHEDGQSSRYLHLKTDGAAVRVGDRVRAGDVVGWSGNSGRSSRPHLHFDVVSDCDDGPCPTIPATFLNASHRAPRAGRTYQALDRR